MSVQVVVRAERASATLNRLVRRLDDGRPQLLRLVDQLREGERELFQDPDRPFKTGALLRSLTVRGDPNQVVRIQRGKLTFGTRIYYARFHRKFIGAKGKAVSTELRRLLLEDL